jgi:Fic family protein
MESTTDTAPAVEKPKDPIRVARSLRAAETRRANTARRVATVLERYPLMGQNALLTKAEIARIKDCSLATVERRIADGTLKVVKGRWLVRARKADVERMP